MSWEIAAPREIVFDVIAGPYLGRTPHALEEKLQVWERGSDMVLASHLTAVKCGRTATLEEATAGERLLRDRDHTEPGPWMTYRLTVSAPRGNVVRELEADDIEEVEMRLFAA